MENFIFSAVTDVINIIACKINTISSIAILISILRAIFDDFVTVWIIRRFLINDW